jgi:RNA polymerase sigma-70 factor (ECF subfamily)
MSRDTDAEANADLRRRTLMVAAQAGNAAAYTELLRECIPLIRAAAARRAPAGRVDDVVQDTLLTLHRARQTYDPARSFTGWLLTIADRRAIDIMRRVARNASREVHAPAIYDAHADDTAAPDREVVRGDLTARVGRAVARLAERQREAVQHLILGEKSLDETAEITGRTKGALKVNLHRALKSLRAKLERETG